MVRNNPWSGKREVVLLFLFVVSLFFYGIILAVTPTAGTKIPAWLQALASQPLPEFPPETGAVCLLLEQDLKYTSKGVLVRSGRQAVKVLRAGGESEALSLVRTEDFNTRVKRMNGWVINPDGYRDGLDIKSAVITSLAPGTLYQDDKTLVLVLPEIKPGSLAGFEWEEEIQPVSLEDTFIFQRSIPVLEARYSLSPVADGQAIFEWINWPQVPVTVSGPTRLAQLKNIPAIKDEPLRPGDRAVAGRVLVRLQPGSSPRFGRFFSNWKDLGLWYEALTREKRRPDERVRAKAVELLSGREDVESKIKALAGFVQREIRYVSIQVGMGAWQPHPASLTLSNLYGDCKDMVTLLAALLEVAGINSYLLLVNTERLALTPASPVSIFSFDHALLAISLPDGSSFSGHEAVIADPELGRLLIFDPSATQVPPGRLPHRFLGGCGLLVAGESSRLCTLPVPEARNHSLLRQGKFVLTAEGLLTGQVRETLSGSVADPVRSRLRLAGEKENRDYLENLLAQSLTSFKLEKWECGRLDEPEADLQLDYSFSASSYLSKVGELMSFKPFVLTPVLSPEILNQKGVRTYPVLPGVVEVEEKLEIALPEGYVLESLPREENLSNDFAEYHCRFELKESILFVERHIGIKQFCLPPERFEEVMKFFRAAYSGERIRLLLRKR
ncbi:MAG: DUF3857 and transglutaminase domain-containing protein [Candidatus Aminicenantes bacterium]|nr:DUF3857 and transglutaminase domain-containing protein [Candidatus Aminicenantes bacterium]